MRKRARLAIPLGDTANTTERESRSHSRSSVGTPFTTHCPRLHNCRDNGEGDLDRAGRRRDSQQLPRPDPAVPAVQSRPGECVYPRCMHTLHQPTERAKALLIAGWAVVLIAGGFVGQASMTSWVLVGAIVVLPSLVLLHWSRHLPLTLSQAIHNARR